MTTLDLITKKSSLKSYETVEIKRRLPTGYETDWQDVSSYLLQGSDLKVSSKLDFDSFGYGEFKTSNATIHLDNKLGYFNNENDMYSFFSNTVSRHYSKVRYTAGYYAASGKVNEVIFIGLINEKEIKNNFTNGTIEITVLSLNQILHESFASSGSLGSSNYFTQIVSTLMSSSLVSGYVLYDAGNINPYLNVYFDNPAYYEGKAISDILSEICKRANSAWYIDIDGYLIIRTRSTNDNTPFNFIGGSGQKYSTNILNIEMYDEGYSKIINGVIYKTTSTYQVNASSEYLTRYGMNNLIFESDDITDQDVITTLSENIIAEWKLPRRRIVLTTIYMPNILNYFDKCIVTYSPKIKRMSKDLLVFNVGQFNAGLYFGVYENRIIIRPDRYYSYYGYEHDLSKGITRHYLIEDSYIGQGASKFVFNLSQWNNGDFFNV